MRVGVRVGVGDNGVGEALIVGEMPGLGVEDGVGEASCVGLGVAEAVAGWVGERVAEGEDAGVGDSTV